MSELYRPFTKEIVVVSIPQPQRTPRCSDVARAVNASGPIAPSVAPAEPDWNTLLGRLEERRGWYDCHLGYRSEAAVLGDIIGALRLSMSSPNRPETTDREEP